MRRGCVTLAASQGIEPSVAEERLLGFAHPALGALVSGGVATRLLSRGLPVNRVRKLAMLVSGLMVLVLPLATQADSAWGAAAILAVVLAAHQGFSTNLFALIADVTDKPKIGRVTSFAAFCGNIGGMTIVKVAGLVLTAGLGYGPLYRIPELEATAVAAVQEAMDVAARRILGS